MNNFYINTKISHNIKQNRAIQIKNLKKYTSSQDMFH